MQGRIKTFQFLTSLQLPSTDMCVFCGLNIENCEHLFNTCMKTRYVWLEMGDTIGKSICFPIDFALVKSIIAVDTWLLWKSMCNLIFQKPQPDFSWMVTRDFDHVEEYSI